MSDDPNTIIKQLLKACRLYKRASVQGHYGHWDSMGTFGANCPECIRARELREKANAILDNINMGKYV